MKTLENLLVLDNSFLLVKNDMEEGRDYISLWSGSKSVLGRALSYTNPRRFNTFIGEVSGIRRFVVYLSTKDLPISFLLKGKYTKEDHELVRSKESLSLTNYWAVVAYALIERIRNDKKLQEMIYENTLPFTAITWKKTPSILNNVPNMKVGVNNIRLANYLAIVRNIEALIKNDMFTSANMKELIRFHMVNKDVDIFDGSIILNGRQGK